MLGGDTDGLQNLITILKEEGYGSNELKLDDTESEKEADEVEKSKWSPRAKFI